MPMKMEQSVPKRRHIKFRRCGITQKKSYNKEIVAICSEINTKHTNTVWAECKILEY